MNRIDRIIQAAIELEAGSQTRAAARLRIGLRTVQRHMGRARLAPSGPPSDETVAVLRAVPSIPKR